MDFITTEEATALGLTTEQVTALTPKYNDHVAGLKKEWDGVANTNAENILSGAAKYAQTKLGVTDERQAGEKWGDYMNRIADKSIESKAGEVERLKTEYAQKLKDFRGDDATKAELDAAKAELDKAKQILANYDEIKGKADKYDEASESLKGLKLEVAFTDVKPKFPDTVNSYEASAKWEAFKKGILEKHTIELVDGVAMAIDKENQYKTTKLSDLVAADKDLEELTKGRQQSGNGAHGAGKNIKIDGVDFEVPENAKTDSKERTKAIREQLAKENIPPTHDDYTKKFSEYNKKIMSGK